MDLETEERQGQRRWSISGEGGLPANNNKRYWGESIFSPPLPHPKNDAKSTKVYTFHVKFQKKIQGHSPGWTPSGEGALSSEPPSALRWSLQPSVVHPPPHKKKSDWYHRAWDNRNESSNWCQYANWKVTLSTCLLYSQSQNNSVIFIMPITV